MFGLNFIQTGFLFAGVFAAAIPIAIHLLLKQRARRVPIGSVRFLQKVIRQHNRMRRIRQWLLLAARVITILLLAMLFARPFFDRTAFEASQQEILYLLDRSASMQLGDGESIFDEAYAALQRELDEVHSETIVRVALADGQGVEELDWEANSEVPDTSFAGTDYGKAIAWARDALLQSTRTDKEIVFFTDLQKVGVGPTTVDGFPANIKLNIRDLGRSISSNISIQRATAVATEIRPKMPPTVEVELHNNALTSVRASVRLRLKNPEEKLVTQTQAIVLEGASRQTVRFELHDAIAGTYTGSAEVEVDDELRFDNLRYVAFEARHPDRLLIVDGQEGSSVYGDETYFLETALRVGQETPNRELPSYEMERIIWDNGKGFPNLEGFRVIVLANVGSFTDEDAQRLQQFLETGGRVLVCCGDRFTRRAAQPLTDSGLLPASIEGVASIGPYRISKCSEEHPIFQPFQDPQAGDIRSLRFTKIARLNPIGSAQVLAQTPAGEPLLVEQTIGNGKVLLLASTVDTAWTSFPRGRLFVPLIRQMMGYLTDQQVRESAVEETIAVDQPGVTVKDGRIIVANVPPEESELARMTPAEFRQAFDLPEKQEFADLSPEELASLAPPTDSERPEEIWTTIAWILLVWLLVETFLAGRVHA